MSKPTLENILDLLKEKEEASDRSDLTIATFDTPNWAYRQAYRNGYRAAFKAMIHRLTYELNSKETPDG